MNFQVKKNISQAGFTLIELVVVIVILGILAATALPKFASMQIEARTATLKAAMGAVSSAVATTHGKFLAAETSSGSFVTMEGKTATNKFGFPLKTEIAALAGVDNSPTDYSTSQGASNLVVYATKASDTVTCAFTYTEASDTVTPATVNGFVATGC